VDPGQRLSYQKHFRRSEHWIILEGRARITLDGKEIFLGQGESVDIPHPPKGALTESDREALGEIPLASEEEEARYLHDALDLLRGHGLSGAIARSFLDCDPSLWSKTPFDRRVQVAKGSGLRLTLAYILG